MRRLVSAFALCSALSLASAGALAQHPEGHGHEPAAAAEGHGEHGNGEHGGNAPGHGGHEVHEGFHHPPAMNWFNPSPPAEVQQHGDQRVEVKGPTPFIGPLINFAILLVLGYMALRRSINPSLEARRAAMETEIAEAGRLRTEAEAMHKEYSDRLARLGDEIEKLKREFVEAGEAERDRIVADAQIKAERMREDGVRAVAQEMAMAREELRRETVLAAAATAEETVRRAINAQDHQRLTDDYLGGLEAVVQKRGTEGASA